MMIKKKTVKKDDFLKFLGTAGARFVMIKQLRHSGGIWVSCKGTNVLIDPGPGSIVHCAAAKPKLDPSTLDGIVLTHRHLDHSGDINVMIEAMTEGGFKKKGEVFCPEDALGDDSVMLRYLRSFPEDIRILKDKTDYVLKDFSFQTSQRHIHPVETYGLRFRIKSTTVGLLTDTRYSRELNDFYNTDILIIAVVFYEPRPGIDHLSIEDVKTLVGDLKPKKTILTHFGMGMLKAKPHVVAERLSKSLKQEIVAAYDGMTLEF